jgi:spore cortex formation protein SpoVR/YcgB (stage V sporulation)
MTMETWFRFDPINMRPFGYLSTVFALFDSLTNSYKLGFQVSNTFMRIFINNKVEDIHYKFNETAGSWHYLAVSYARKFEQETRLYVYLDNTQILETTVFDWFQF